MPRRTSKELPPPFPADDEDEDEFEDEPLQFFMSPPGADQTTNLIALTNAARELIDYIKATDVAELRLESGSTRISIKRALALPPSAQPMMPLTTYADAVLPTPTAPTQPAATPAEPVLPSNAHPIVSPMVGTFYHAPNPKDKPYVSEGDRIEKGQTIGLIEAMKMMNEIDSDVSGTVLKVVAANGQAVEYGQPLVLVEPDPQ